MRSKGNYIFRSATPNASLKAENLKKKEWYLSFGLCKMTGKVRFRIMPV